MAQVRFSTVLRFKITNTIMILVAILIMLFAICCNGYVSLVLLKSWPTWAKSLTWVPVLAICFCMDRMVRTGSMASTQSLMVLLICWLSPILLLCVSSLIGQGLECLIPGAYHWGKMIGCVLGGLFFVCSIYGATFGWKQLEIKEVAIESPALPAAFDGFKIVQISDLHLGTFGSDTKHIESIINKIADLSPGLIVFTGDLVNFNYKEALPFVKALSQLKAPNGVMSVLGNHDYALYDPKSDSKAADRKLDSLISLQRSMGWQLLLDENRKITLGDSSIYVAGVQNVGKHFAVNRGDYDKAVKGIPIDAFTILLSHDPTHWDAIAGKKPIDLTLSGHTHAMQFKLFGWSPSSMIFKRWGGLHQQGQQWLYVNTGTGGNMPFRFGAWPEITLITLKHK